MQGGVDPTILAERTDQELLLQYFQNIEDKKKPVVLNGAEDGARNGLKITFALWSLTSALLSYLKAVIYCLNIF
jgi:hypothetical protein